MKVTVAPFIIILILLSLTHSFSLLVHERFFVFLFFSSSSIFSSSQIPPSQIPHHTQNSSITGKEDGSLLYRERGTEPNPSKIKINLFLPFVSTPIKDQESKSTHPRSRIKINPSSFQPIQDQESKSTHLRSNPSKIKNQNQPIFVSTHSKPIYAFMGGHRPAEPGHWLMGFSPSVPSSCSLASCRDWVNGHRFSHCCREREDERYLRKRERSGKKIK
jgi:hypothetical protein